MGGLRQVAVQEDAVEHVQDAHQVRGAEQDGEARRVLALVVKDAQGPGEGTVLIMTLCKLLQNIELYMLQCA